MFQVVLAALMANAALFGPIPSPQPHAIRDAPDAIATAWADWKSNFPKSGVENDNWQAEFTATLVNGIWVIEMKNGGMTINLDPNDGHIISAKIID
jgi:hypothetical protein